MGVLCSSETAGSAFLHLAEDKWIDDNTVRDDYGIMFYGRYEDDIFVVSVRPERMDAFFHDFSSRAAPFRLKQESERPYKCSFLDVTFFKGARWLHNRPLDYKVFNKPTSHWEPLSWSSGHHPSTHRAWPRSMLSRFRLLSSSQARAMEEASKFAAKLLSRSGVHIDCASITALPTKNIKQTRVEPVLPVDTQQFPWLVIPYRHQWQAARLAKVLNEIATKWFNPHSPISIGWCLAGPHLSIALHKLNTEYNSEVVLEFHHTYDIVEEG